MFRSSLAISPLLALVLAAGCGHSEAPLDHVAAGPYNAPVERLHTTTESDGVADADQVTEDEERPADRSAQLEQREVDQADRPAEPAPEAEPTSDVLMEWDVQETASARPGRSRGEAGGRAVPAPTSRPAPSPIAGGEAGLDSAGIFPSYAPIEGLTSGVVGMPPTNDLARLAPGSEHYTEYGVNGFTNPAQDALSTFAVDVDTASYAVTRRKLREGYLPPTAAVRVEEFVNYFPYDYVQPTAGFPFAVDFEAAPSPFNPRNHIVRVGIQGKSIDINERKPVHLTFLVDVSGSMRSADKIGLLKESLGLLTRELEDGDTVAIATYAGRTSVVLPPTPIRNSNTILSALDGLSAGGSTAMSSGIDLAYELANQTYVPGDVNRVIVCSDGDANVGTTSHSAISAQIRGYAEQGITLTTLGFGNGNYQDTMMERLANDGDGNYFYIDALPEARRVLVDRMTGTLEVIAKDVKIQVAWDPEQVLAYRLIGYENRDVADRDFRNDAVDAGEIGSGHQVTALYEVALADNPTGELATVRIRNKAPGPDSPAVERTYSLGAKTLTDSFGTASAQFRIATAASGFAEVLRGSPHMSEVSLSQVLSIARDAQRVEYQEDAELLELIDRAAKLRGEGAFVQR